MFESHVLDFYLALLLYDVAYMLRARCVNRQEKTLTYVQRIIV